MKEQVPYIKQNKINATKEAETKGLIWLKKGKEVDLKKKTILMKEILMKRSFAWLVTLF